MKKYYGIDWLRAVACIGILVMHIAANTRYTISGFLYQQVIPSFTDFVYLFMAISAFGMCCGYYDKVMSGQVNWTDFYGKRYAKILPFFCLLIVLDLVMNFSRSALYEGLVELTLLHGFIPDSLNVIGVGWFLGTVFIFYLTFPFFCVLMEEKRRALWAFLLSIPLNYICLTYFNLNRHNFLCSFCYFLAGGLLYLYKDKLQNVKWYYSIPALCLALLVYFLAGGNTLTRLCVVMVLLVCAISSDCRKSRIAAFLSSISLEIYLSHMVIFRAVELLGLTKRWGNGWGQFLTTSVLVTAGTVLFSFVTQRIIKHIHVPRK